MIASPAVLDGVVYFPTADGVRFKALDTATGQLIFSVVNKDVSFSSPALVNGIAYYGTTDGWVHAVDIETGRMVHEFQTQGSKENSGKYLNDQGAPDAARIFPDQTLDGVMVGLNRIHSLGSVLSSPVAAGGILYFGSTDGNLYAIE